MEAPPFRFAMTLPPQPGGNPGSYEERLAQWFLEHTFFLDFVYRNPRGKGGKGELADALVLHGDVALMTQVKAQSSQRSAKQWARGAIEDAMRQLRYTHRMLFTGVVRELESSTLGTVLFHADHYTSRCGLIILEQPEESYAPRQLVPELAELPFPVHVISLADFNLISQRFDTAGDFISYLDFRRDLFDPTQLPVHREAEILREIAKHAGDVLRRLRPALTDEVLSRSVSAFQAKASGQLARSLDWRYSLAIDDIIARLHERDPSLPWNRGSDHETVMRVAGELSWLTRDRRIQMGKRLVEMCEHALDGNAHDFSHYLRATQTAFLFVATDAPRAERVQYLQALTLFTQAKHDATKVIGVATEPLGPGRSYDVVLRSGKLEPTTREQILAARDRIQAEADET